MPARNTKRRRPPELRQRRPIPIQNKPPPADSFNLEARSFSTWPSSLLHRHLRQSGSDLVGPTVSRVLSWTRRSTLLQDRALDGFTNIARHPEPGPRDLALAQAYSNVCGIPHRLCDSELQSLEQLDLHALSFPTQAAKIALWKLLDARFRSRN